MTVRVFSSKDDLEREPILDSSIPSREFPVQSEGTNASLPISADFDGR